MSEDAWVSGIHQYRQQIDGIDVQMIEYLARRFEAAKRIAELKKVWDQPVVQPDRVVEVEQRYIHRGQMYSLSGEFMSRLYHLIHEETCRLEAELMAGGIETRQHDNTAASGICGLGSAGGNA